MQHMAAPLQRTAAVHAVSGTAEIASSDNSIRVEGPSPSKAARAILNGVGVEQVSGRALP